MSACENCCAPAGVMPARSEAAMLNATMPAAAKLAGSILRRCAHDSSETPRGQTRPAAAFWLLLGTHFIPGRTKLRLGLVQARHKAVCSYLKRWSNVEGGYRPEPPDISRNVLALVVNALDRLAVLDDEVIRPIGMCGWRQPSWTKRKSHWRPFRQVICSVANFGTFLCKLAYLGERCQCLLGHNKAMNRWR